MRKKKVLIIEDDASLLDIFAFTLARNNCDPIRADSGLMGLAMTDTQIFDLILVDTARTVPGTMDICLGLREEGVTTPILALLTNPELDDHFPELGVTVIRKPFPMQDLLFQVKLNTWEKEYQEEPGQKQLSFSRLVFLPDQARVLKDGVPVDLVAREYDLLYCMARRPGHTFSREELLQEVWGYSYLGNPRIVDVAMRRLRGKIEDDPGHPEFVITRRGRGYSFSGI